MVDGISKALTARVGALEGKVAKLESFRRDITKQLEPLFRAQAQSFERTLADELREQAELIDRLFILRFEEWDKRWDLKLEQTLEEKLEQKLEEKLEQKFEAKLQPLRQELAIVREGIGILLKKGR
jgi:high-affinity Fe2+/Pb2+ permease